VIAAQAFHWFTPYPAAYMECRRLLKPGGALALIWNERDPAVPWIKAFDEEVVTPLYPKDNAVAPRQQSRKWKDAFEHFLGNYYGNLHNTAYRGRHGVVQEGGWDMVVNRVLSLSVVGGLPKEEKDAVEATVREWLGRHPDTKGKEEDLTLSYFTDVYYTRTIG